MRTQTKMYKAALYMRLSKEDDDCSTESASIQTQRKMLRTFAKENGFLIHDEYIDDGWSGTNFDRPDFKRMIGDIKAKYINMVITKDLSRLGRDYITSGQYTEIFFPEHQIRYIAINDGYDSVNPYNDIAPFKHVINEMYARDTSKKIRSAFATKMKDGSFIGNFAPYGYQKDPANKNHLIIDYEVSPIVQEMFHMAQNGHNPSEIARAFNMRGVLTPSMYRCIKRPYLNVDDYSQRKEWTSSMICKMLKNIVYLGHMAQGKTSKISFKSRIILSKSQDDWYIVKDTHEPLISQESFDRVRQRSVSRKNFPITGFKNVFSGIAKCMDCGRNMSSTGTRKKGSIANLVCGGYKLYGSNECSNHFIDYQTLHEIVLKELQRQICLSDKDKQEILESLGQEQQKEQSTEELKKARSALVSRIRELDKIIQRLYEDNLIGKINDDRFSRMLETYETEQRDIRAKVGLLSKIAEPEPEKESYQKFLHLLQEVADIPELTPDILHKFIERIEIGQGYFKNGGRNGHKCQTIRIFYRFIGNIDEQVIA